MLEFYMLVNSEQEYQDHDNKKIPLELWKIWTQIRKSKLCIVYIHQLHNIFWVPME